MSKWLAALLVFACWIGLGQQAWAEEQTSSEPVVETVSEKIDWNEVNKVMAEVFNQVIDGDDIVKELLLSLDPEVTDLELDRYLFNLHSKVAKTPWMEDQTVTSDIDASLSADLDKLVNEQDESQVSTVAKLGFKLSYKTKAIEFIKYLVNNWVDDVMADPYDLTEKALVEMVDELKKVNQVNTIKELYDYLKSLRLKVMEALVTYPLPADPVEKKMQLRDLAEAMAFLNGIDVDSWAEEDNGDYVYKKITVSLEQAIASVQDEYDREFFLPEVKLFITEEGLSLSLRAKIIDSSYLSYYEMFKAEIRDFFMQVQKRMNMDEVTEMARGYFELVKDLVAEKL